ncbi:MAG TPA: SpoIIE family protein phosphatase [Planctomycetaceae bacterium]|jgi:sigma-B regulation protein RsbU (phosphoserine phosphatase)|nr:SpoIIE family protein phosphatase [Planctomycetaceae bacterium]
MREALGSLLVVDDDAFNRDIICPRLEQRGYRVDTASDGQMALEKIQSGSYDLILLDIVMPLLNGLQVLEETRHYRSRAQLPVIMVTSLDAPHDIVDALKAGANDYVTKPIDIEVLLARVGTHVILKRMAESLEESNRRLEHINSQLRRDLEAAAKIQRSLLPTYMPTFDNYEFAWKYEPCERLGGDHLNIMALSENQIGFYVLDVSGHGVQAALMSVAINHLLEPSQEDTSVVNRPNRQRKCETDPGFFASAPNEVAERLNRHFTFDLAVAQYFTIFYAVLNRRERICRYVSTGHPAPIHLTADGDLRVLESSGLPIGIFQPGEAGYQPFEERILELKPGDRLCVYSDGIVELRNPAQEEFGMDGLSQALRASRQKSLDQCVEDVFAATTEWGNGAPLSDDLSMLALDVR